MEAAGVALAIVPLITIAVASYNDISRGIRRYREFSNKVDEIFAELNVQSTIFRTAVQLLFASFVGPEEASQMLADKDHPRWDDPDLESFLHDRFEERFSAMIDSMSLLDKRLNALRKLSESFRSIVQDVEQDISITLKNRARRIRKKFGLACSQSEVETLIKSVKDQTQDFRILVRQSEKISERKCLDMPSVSVQTKVARFAAVNSAANDLYEAFGKACTKHLEHTGYIGLKPLSSQRDQVNFTLALKQLTIRNASNLAIDTSSDSMVWMTIESQLGGAIRSQKPVGSLKAFSGMAKCDYPLDTPGAENSACASFGVSCVQTAGKPFNSSQADCILKECRKKVFSNVNPIKSSEIAALSHSIISADPLPNLCDRDNLCNLVQNILRTANQTMNRCIGYLETGTNLKHLLYLNSQKGTIAESMVDPNLISLGSLLAETSKIGPWSNAVLQHGQYRTAKQLSMALLRFRNTKWLHGSWNSDNIMVSRPVNETQPSASKNQASDSEMFANVSIRLSKANDLCTPQRTSPYIRNRALFDLGKMLLELAYDKPFCTLLSLERKDLSVDQQVDSEYFVASKLRYSVSSKAGLEYSELVRKCIECDFGQGHDLSKEGLQTSFYYHVIDELEKCEIKAQREA